MRLLDGKYWNTASEIRNSSVLIATSTAAQSRSQVWKFVSPHLESVYFSLNFYFLSLFFVNFQFVFFITNRNIVARLYKTYKEKRLDLAV